MKLYDYILKKIIIHKVISVVLLLKLLYLLYIICCVVNVAFRLCLRVWSGREDRALEGRIGASERNKRYLKGKTLGVSSFFIIQNPPHLGELKNCIEGGFGGFI